MRQKANGPLESLQVGRGIAASSVVLFHAAKVIALPEYWHYDTWKTYLLPGNSGVYFFFVLSGFIIMYAHQGDIGLKERLKKYIANRVTRIYPIYWIVSTCALALQILLFAQHFNILSLIGTFSLIPVVGDRGNLAVAWTLFHEMTFYILFMICIWSKRVGALFLGAWFGLCLSATVVILHNRMLGAIFSPINLLFLFGIASCWLSSKMIGFPRTILFLSLSAFAALWIGQVYLRMESDGRPSWEISYGLVSGAIIWSAVVIERHAPIGFSRLLCLLGNASYSIYLTHFLTISAIAKLLHRHVPIITPTLVLPIMYAISCGLGVLFYQYVERPLLVIARNLVFHKFR